MGTVESLYQLVPEKISRKGRFWMARTPRVASTSIIAAVNISGPIRGKRYFDVDDSPVLLFVRDPIKRLGSAWRFFTQGAGSTRPYPYDWEQFVDGILSGEVTDTHTVSQTIWHTQRLDPEGTHGQRFLPTHMYPFEKMNELWGEWFLTPIEHLHESQPIETTQYRDADLHEHYADDFSLRDAL